MRLKGRRVSKRVEDAGKLDARTQQAVDELASAVGPIGIATESVEHLKKFGKISVGQHNANVKKHQERLDKLDREHFAKLPKKLRDKATKDIQNAAKQIKEKHTAKKYNYKFLEPKKVKK